LIENIGEIMKAFKKIDEFDEVVDEATDEICEKADKCRQRSDISGDYDITALIDDMREFELQVDSIRNCTTTKQLKRALDKIFEPKEVKCLMKNLA
jgi:uncharacterized protein (UPF0371 family)